MASALGAVKGALAHVFGDFFYPELAQAPAPGRSILNRTDTVLAPSPSPLHFATAAARRGGLSKSAKDRPLHKTHAAAVRVSERRQRAMASRDRAARAAQEVLAEAAAAGSPEARARRAADERSRRALVEEARRARGDKPWYTQLRDTASEFNAQCDAHNTRATPPSPPNETSAIRQSHRVTDKKALYHGCETASPS
jgi:hypothetical protein